MQDPVAAQSVLLRTPFRAAGCPFLRVDAQGSEDPPPRALLKAGTPPPRLRFSPPPPKGRLPTPTALQGGASTYERTWRQESI